MPPRVVRPNERRSSRVCDQARRSGECRFENSARDQSWIISSESTVPTEARPRYIQPAVGSIHPDPESGFTRPRPRPGLGQVARTRYIGLVDERRAIRWLYEQLPSLVAKNVLTNESADSLRSHFGPQEPPTRRAPLIIVAVVGSLFVGIGIILLVAHNWQSLGRTARAVLAFLPLVLAIAVSVRIGSRRSSQAARESAAMFQTLAVAASLALVSQTYHTWPGLDRFLLPWLLLSAPLIYLFRSVMVAVVYVAGITIWSEMADSYGFLWFWVLIGLVVPFYLDSERMKIPARSWLASTLSVAVLLEFLFHLEVSGGKPSLLAMSGVAASLYIVGTRWFGRQHPFRWVGGMAIVILTIALSYRSTWDRYASDYGSPQGVAAWILTGVALALLISSVRSGASINPWAALLPVLCAFSIAIDHPIIPVGLINLYGLAFGIATIVRGVRYEHTVTLNAGMVLVAALTVARFFDTEVSFLLRGVVFIAIGASFLVVNAVTLRRKGAAQP